LSVVRYLLPREFRECYLLSLNARAGRIYVPQTPIYSCYRIDMILYGILLYNRIHHTAI
jgi:hypothetical protein